MIEGMKVSVDGGELIALCEARAKYHEDRAAFYRKQVTGMPAEDVLQFNKSGSNSPMEAMQERIEKHQDQAAEMVFTAKHLLRGESYRLDRGDLVLLGIVKGGYFR